MSNIQTLIIYAQFFGVSPIHIENNLSENLKVVDIKKKFLRIKKCLNIVVLFFIINYTIL